MAISFVRIDDRMIHGLITVRWGKEWQRLTRRPSFGR